MREYDSILGPDEDLVAEIVRTGSSDLLWQLFESRTSRWKYWYFTGEFSSGLFSDLAQQIRPELAFGLIPMAAEIALAQTDADLFATALSLVMELARSSDTTEMPQPLEQTWERLGQRAKEFATDDCEFVWDSLVRWYRSWLKAMHTTA